MKVLQINSGVFGDDSQSTSLASSFIEKLKLANSNLEITLRDVIAQPIPHLDANILSAFMTAEADRTVADVARFEGFAPAAAAATAAAAAASACASFAADAAAVCRYAARERRRDRDATATSG